jgi:hypothetical protein
MGSWTRPDINTKFHIDFDWWKNKGQNFRIFLQSHLCSECRTQYATFSHPEEIDWIDPDTAEVTRVDGLWQSLRTCCSQKPDYITETTPLTAAVFRVFLANDNTPLSPVELYQITHKKSPEIILRTLAGKEVYQGIKPVMPKHKSRGARRQ